MKKLFISLGVLVLLLVGATIWLSSSVGPETAPQEIQAQPVEIDASR